MRLFEPLKSLLWEETEWTWDSCHQDAFDAIKELSIVARRKTSNLNTQNSHSRRGTLFQHREGIARSGIRHGEASQLCVW